MHFQDIQEFLTYYGKVRARTLRVVQTIPPDHIEWTYKAGRFSLGDQVRHIATIERYMYAENAQFKPSRYPGCGVDLASGYDQVVQYFNDLHQESLAIFSTLSPAQLQQKCETPGGIKITLWKWLRAMVEHEIHHRGQIYMLLGMLGVQTPPIYGLTSEEVLKRSQ